MTDFFDVTELKAASRADPSRAFAANIYWERLAPHLKEFGITRVSDITGLDILGVPVAQACRPASRSNAVTQGKGNDLFTAAISAVLECIEMAVGEDLSSLTPWSGADLDRDLWAKLAPGVTGWPDERTEFVTGWDVERAAPCAVPRDVLSTDFSLGAKAEAAPILRSSIGMGAGSSFAEAIWHGLLECVENDAQLRSSQEGSPRALRQMHHSPIGDDGLSALVGNLEEKGLRLGLWDISVRPGPRCVFARILEDPEHASGLPLPADGFACRSTYGGSATAALLEAIQARLAVISGAREDMTWTLYRSSVDRHAIAAEWEMLAQRAGPLPPAQTCPATSYDLAKNLGDFGMGPIIVVPLLARVDIPLFVCRIVAPNLLADPERVLR